MNIQTNSSPCRNPSVNSVFLIKNTPEYEIYAQNILTQSWLQWIISWFRGDIKVTIENSRYHVKVRDIAQKLGIAPNRAREIAKRKNSFKEFEKMAIIKKFDSIYPHAKNLLTLTQKNTLAELFATNERILADCLFNPNYQKISTIIELIKSDESFDCVKKILESEEFFTRGRVVVNNTHFFRLNNSLYKSVISTKPKLSNCYHLVTAIQSIKRQNQYGIIQEIHDSLQNKINHAFGSFPAQQNQLLCRFLRDEKKLPIAKRLLKTRHEAFNLFHTLFSKETILTHKWGKVGSTRYFLSDDRIFKTDRVLGVGTYGKVYHATDINSGAEYAVKRTKKKINIEGTHVPSPIPFNELKSEYESLVNIHQTARKVGIVSLSLKTEGPILKSPFIVLEYYSGGDLTSAYRKLSSTSIKDALLLCRQLLQGLRILHSLNYGHGDIKPTNCLMKKDEKDEIIEFAISDLGSAVNLAKIPRDSSPSIAHTPNYRPSDWNYIFSFAEKIQSGDVYAMAQTIVETLSGCKITNLLNSLFEPSLRLATQELTRRGIPKSISDVLLQGLVLFPKRRPSVEQLLNNYDQALRAAGIAIPD